MIRPVMLSRCSQAMLLVSAVIAISSPELRNPLPGAFQSASVADLHGVIALVLPVSFSFLGLLLMLCLLPSFAMSLSLSDRSFAFAPCLCSFLCILCHGLSQTCFCIRNLFLSRSLLLCSLFLCLLLRCPLARLLHCCSFQLGSWVHAVVLSLCSTLLLLCRTLCLFLWLRCRSGSSQPIVVDVAAVALLSQSVERPPSRGLAVLCCCLSQILQAHTPNVRSFPQSCCGRMWVSAALSTIQAPCSNWDRVSVVQLSVHFIACLMLVLPAYCCCSSCCSLVSMYFISCDSCFHVVASGLLLLLLGPCM